MNRKIVALFLTLFVLAGCSAKGPIYQNQPTLENDDARIIVYRPSRFLSRWRGSWVVVNREMRSLRNNGYLVFELKPGKYYVNAGTRQVEVNLKSQDEVFVRYRKGWSFLIFPEIAPDWAKVVDRDVAMSEITKTKLSANKAELKAISDSE